jgi:hypothetical protein
MLDPPFSSFADLRTEIAALGREPLEGGVRPGPLSAGELAEPVDGRPIWCIPTLPNRRER